ncbi:MAG: 16S rRNA (adenine(1518)-N(6)/adenine(1519)-N(6))-dimethyltransferase RsmA [Bacilli bacterium]|nr:16S rRNA (adenine(1518)-N(6)/adenine(1519)-N(6))-dimethyltransferase RsmA [Bacilli bacterium]MDD4809075.1 16S rRNA (adenine(1518)-N(6)/adenine(1519)-N(6))-dimethyltransferase RsmA [Bacilli bacterium]
MEYSPTKLQQLLNDNNFNFKKSLGQNFIVDENIIDAIIHKSKIDKDTLVIEVGPGAGALTYKLGQVAKQVIAYEIDTRLKDILNQNLGCFDNVDIIFEDFLKVDLTSTLKKYKYDKLYVIANLPYYITTPIIMKFIEEDIDVDKIVVMVQKEVGDRFKAKTGTKDYNSLSIFLNYYFEINKLLDVSKNVFLPKPKVDSIVIEFKQRETKLILKNKTLFFKLIKDSFKQKRKTLKNNLRDYDLSKIEKTLTRYNFSLSSRAEQIPIEVFAALANDLSE